MFSRLAQFFSRFFFQNVRTRFNYTSLYWGWTIMLVEDATIKKDRVPTGSNLSELPFSFGREQRWINHVLAQVTGHISKIEIFHSRFHIKSKPDSPDTYEEVCWWHKPRRCQSHGWLPLCINANNIIVLQKTCHIRVQLTMPYKTKVEKFTLITSMQLSRASAVSTMCTSQRSILNGKYLLGSSLSQFKFQDLSNSCTLEEKRKGEMITCINTSMAKAIWWYWDTALSIRQAINRCHSEKGRGSTFISTPGIYFNVNPKHDRWAICIPPLLKCCHSTCKSHPWPHAQQCNDMATESP